MKEIIEFFNQNPIARICLDAYLILLIVSLVVFLMFRIKRLVPLILIGCLLLVLDWLAI